MPENERIEMEPVGQMTGDCQEIRLLGALKRIRTASNRYQKDKTGLNGIRYYRENWTKTFGKIEYAYDEWKFSEDKRLVGILGVASGGDID